MAVGLGHAGMPESDALELVPTSIVRHVFLRRAAKPEVLVGDEDVDNELSEHVENDSDADESSDMRPEESDVGTSPIVMSNALAPRVASTRWRIDSYTDFIPTRIAAKQNYA